MADIESRADRITVIAGKKGFPPVLGQSIIAINQKCEGQLTQYHNLSLALLDRAYPQGYEPRYASFNGVLTFLEYPRAKMFFNPQSWGKMPSGLREIFIYDHFLDSHPFWGSVDLDLPLVPDYSTNPARKVDIDVVFSQLKPHPQPKEMGGLRFRVGFIEQAPAIPGYIHDIIWATRNHGDLIMETLNSPEYSEIRYGIFAELLAWLQESLAVGEIYFLDSHQ